MCHQPHVEHKKQQHFAYTNYVIIPNTLDIEGLSQNVEKSFSTTYHQKPIETEILTLHLYKPRL